MKRFVTRKQFAAVLTVVALGSAGGTYQVNADRINASNEQAHAVCIDSQKARVQGNDRADVLKKFLEAAIVAREASGTKDDLKAVKKYQDLDKRVHKLPPVVC